MSDTNILWIKGGRVIDPAAQRDAVGDVFAVDGKIVKDLSPEQRKKARVFDAKGLVVSPGFVDIHVHLREPGQTRKETIETGSWAAAAGGVTSLVCMPNTTPAADNPGAIQWILSTVRDRAVVRVYPSGCITVNREGQKLAPIGSLHKAGVVALTDDGSCVQNNEIMRRALEYAKMFNLPVMDHCQDAHMTDGAVMHEGEWSLRLGLHGWPAAAEDIIVQRDIVLAETTGAHMHLQHVSSAYAVDAIRRAKQRGAHVTAEVTPHHLALTDECLRDYDSNFKMCPPLRTQADREALIGGLLDGTIDVIATDHAPHTDYEKDVELAYAPFGITGLETCLPISLEVLYHGGRCGLAQVIEYLTSKPARLLNLPGGTLAEGAPADIAIFNPNETWVYAPETVFSRSQNSPWLNKPLKGKVHATFVGGQCVFEDGKIFPKGEGREPMTASQQH